MLKNLLRYSVASVTTLFMFLLLMLAGRQLGAEDFGRFTFAMALVFLFDPIMDPGIYHYLVREMARDRRTSDRFFAHALTWKLLVAIPVFILVYVTVNWMHDSPKTLWAVYLMTVSAWLKSYKDAFRIVLFAHERFGLDALSLVIERSSLLLVGAIVLLTNQGLIALCLVFVVVRGLDLIIISAIVRQLGFPVRAGKDLTFLTTMIRGALPVGALYITLNVYNSVDAVMLSLFRSEAEVGWYGASYKIYEGLLILPGIIATVFLPRLSRLSKESATEFQVLFGQGMKYLFLLALVVSVNGVIVSEWLVPLLFGAAFTASVVSTNILFLGVVFAFCLNFLQMSMISTDLQKVVFYGTVVGLAANVLLNLVLIPRLGYVGAALSTVVVEGALLVSFLRYLRHTILKVDPWRLYGVPTLAMAAACTPVFTILATAPWGIRILLFNAMFTVLLFVFRVLGESEIDAVLTLFRRSRHEAVGVP